MISKNYLQVRALCFLVVIALQLCIARRNDVERILTIKDTIVNKSKKIKLLGKLSNCLPLHCALSKMCIVLELS